MRVPIVAAALLACSPCLCRALTTPVGPPGKNAPTATVQNDRTEPVEVFLEFGDEEVRLGVVPPNDEATFPLPSWLADGIRTVDFFVHPRNGFDQETGSMALKWGEHVGIIVPETKPAKDRTPAPPPPSPSDSTMAEVQNDGSSPVTVYLERGNSEVRLGTVEAYGTGSFRIPSAMVTPFGTTVEFTFHPKKGFDQSTGPMTIRSGHHVGIEVGA